MSIQALKSPFPTENALPSPQTTEPKESEDAPDWLLRIREKKETEANYTQLQKNKGFSKETTNSITEKSESDGKANAKSKETIPDWLSQMRNVPTNSEDKSSVLDSSDLPDWLTGKEIEDSLTDENENQSQEEDLPDWLTNISSQQAHEPENAKQNWIVPNERDEQNTEETDLKTQAPVSPFGDIPIDEGSQEELPDWLKNASADSPITDFETTPYNGTDPDWLQEISELKQENKTEEKTEEEPEDLFPTHFRPEPTEQSEFIIPPFSDDIPEKMTVSEEPASPDQDIINNEFTPKDQSEQDDINAIFDNQQESIDSAEVSPFSEEVPPLPYQRSSDPSMQPFTLGDMPDWLEDIDKVKNEELEEPSQNQNRTSEEKIQPGSLPGWLKAMRPVSAVVPNEIRIEDRKKIEKSGPLAGLQGVLSSETAINHYTAPPTYASKVNVSDKNKFHSHLLEEIFSQDNKQIKKTVSKSKLEYTVIRLIIPAIIIFGLFFAFFNKTSIGNVLDTGRNMPAVQFASIVNSLSSTLNESPRVLVVMDSDAASIGELGLVTQRTFETFMMQNSWMIFIGTNPSGLIISDEMVSISKQNVPSYNEYERVISLGYLPGNETGIQGFISNPKLMVQLIRDGRSVWDTPGLKNIVTINDFDSIWIISDNAESTQKWIEQLQVIQFNKPVVVSATTQATPMLSAYLKAGQFDGLIGGLQGATTYDQLTTNSQTFFTQTWQLYRTAIFIFLVIILAGAVLQIVESILSSKNK